MSLNALTSKAFSSDFNFGWADAANNTVIKAGVQKTQGSNANALSGMSDGDGSGSKVGDVVGSFAGALKQQMQELGGLQIQANTAIQDYASGNGAPLHQVMTQINRADLSLSLATQVRNKVLNAYQEINRMAI